MKRWDVQTQLENNKTKVNIQDIIELLLVNRGIVDEKQREEFLHPRFADVTVENVKIDKEELDKALKRVEKAIKNQEQIVVFGDYDVDGITGCAILWETLHELGAKVMPYIPHRVEEGYGLSVNGISNVKSQMSNLKLIITVDNGIVAKEAVKFANEQAIDVIVTDHHEKDAELPESLAIVHTTHLCGSGVAYLFSKEIRRVMDVTSDSIDSHLELATLGTIADLVPLTGANRILVTFGLPKVSKTRRVGLQELFKQAGITKDDFSPYEIGFIVGPRLNAAGRIESAMDSLRLLCTRDKTRAKELAEKLEFINKERQLLMRESAKHAIDGIRNGESGIKKILIVAHETYNQGVIGLVAGKLVEEFYRPAIVLTKGEEFSKASVRSVSGFNIIEFLRSRSDFFVNVGGHPMAAGFTIETEKLLVFKQTMEDLAEGLLDDGTLTKSIKIDCEIPFSLISNEFYNEIQQLAPFGMANPEPLFTTNGVTVIDLRLLGKEANHLKLLVRRDKASFEAIGFGLGEMAKEIKIGDKIDLAYHVDINEWNGKKKLQLKIRDIKKSV